MPYKALVEALQLVSLESSALLNSSNEDRRKAFACYLAMREKIAVDYLPLISSRIPYINDHTRKHLERVLAHIESLLEMNFYAPGQSGADIPADKHITWTDTLILLNALVWHDIGNIYGREGHAQEVHDCFKDVAPRMYDGQLAQYVKQVAEAHSGPNAIERAIPNAQAVVRYHSDDIHLQFLAAVLRFADELDEDSRRISPGEYEELGVVPEDNQRFWFFSKVNSSIKVQMNSGPFNTSLSVHIDSKVPASRFDVRFTTRRRPGTGQRVKTAAMTEYFRRIFKINAERVYCNSYLTTAYNHPGIGSLHINLTTNEPDKPVVSSPIYEIEISNATPPDALLSIADLAPLHPYIKKAIKA